MPRITDVGQLSTLVSAFRRAEELTQADVARRLGVTKSRVSQIETAPERVTVAQLLALLEAIKVEMTLGPRAEVDAGGETPEAW